MKNKPKNKLAGRVAVLISQGEMNRCDITNVSLSTREAASWRESFINLTAVLQKVSFATAENSLDRLSDQLWAGLGSTVDTDNYDFYLPEFANEVVAILGSGNYVFDFTGAVAKPHKLSRSEFDWFLKSIGFKDSANDGDFNMGEAA